MLFPNAIDSHKFAFNRELRKGIRGELKLEDKFVVGHVGRFHYSKNHEYLIRVFAAFCEKCRQQDGPEAMLLLLGEGALMEQTKELCRELAPHCTLAIITNGATIAQKGRFARSAVRDCFSYLFISQELGCRKPEKAFFDKVFAAMGLTDLRDAVVVGDNLLSDIQGGINAGVDTIWYNPDGAVCPDPVRPTYTASDFSAIRSLILG